MPISLQFSFQRSFWKRESVQRTAASENDELPAVHLVRNWRISHSSDRCMPQRRAVTRSQRHRIAGHIASEGDSRISRQHSGSRRGISERMIPFDLSRLIIDCAEESPAGHTVVGPGPAVFAMLRLEEVNAVTVLRAYDE